MTTPAGPGALLFARPARIRQIATAGAMPHDRLARPAIGPGPEGRAFATRVPFCRVAATLSPSSDSNIKIEVWLPSEGWNGKFLAVGNGNWGGIINYPVMADALAAGYATSSTDTGHEGMNARFALGHPEKLVDYAYRSIHEMTVKANAIIQAFYGRAPAQSYFNGCSTGGRQAIMEAERYPADFDGIVAGSVANPRTRLDAWRIASAQAMVRTPEGTIPPEMLPMIHKAVVAYCDGLDGLKDGLIDDPRGVVLIPEPSNVRLATRPPRVSHRHRWQSREL